MKNRNTLKHRLLLGGMLLLAPATPALAQNFAAPEPDPIGAAAPDPFDGPTGLADVVVTATRRETNLQATPIAISVLNAEALENRHVQSLMDLADGAVPGLRVATFEARQSALTIGIRGIVPLDANQPAREQGVGVYVDGVYLGRQHGLGAALLDIERIEVLKGPQGTLFGRNTEGGALSLVTRRPTGVGGVRMTAGVSNYSGYNTDLHIDLPRIGDFSFKIDAAAQHQDATTANPLPGATGWNYFDRQGLRLAVRWQPNDRFTADLSGDIGRDENTPFYSQLLNYNPRNLPGLAPLPPIVQVEGEHRMSVADIGVPQQPSVDETRGLTLNLAYELTPNVELRSITAYREVDVEQWDNAGGAHRPPVFKPNGDFSRYSLAGLWQHQFSQEFQAVGTFDRVDYAAGLYYFNESASDDASTPSTNRWNADGTGYTIKDPTPTIRGHRVMDRASQAEAESWAVYGQATWTPAILDDTLHLTIGGRYTRDEKSGLLTWYNKAVVNLPFSLSSSRFNPMVTVAWDAAPDIHLYAKYATGYRAGGASSRSPTYTTFGPEDVDSYEIGVKSDFFDHRLRLNAAAYVMERTGTQVDFNTIVGTLNWLETRNAPGTSTIKGIELDATAQITPELTISASYAYTDAKVPDTANPITGTIQPVFIVFTPPNAASVAVDYERPLGRLTLRAHLDANYADATQTIDQSAIKNDSAFLVNGRLTLADIPLANGGTIAVSAWARNLLDEEYVYRRDELSAHQVGDYGNFNAPRTFGVEMKAAF